MNLLAIVEEERVDTFPEVETLNELGYDIDTPEQVRGLVGPPDMPPEAQAFYEERFRELSETEAWQDYLVENGWIPAYAGLQEWGDTLERLHGQLETLMSDLGLLDG